MSIKQKIQANNIFLTDGGLETTMIFHHKIELPHFAAFTLMSKPKHHRLLMNYYRDYLNLAVKYKTGFILESPTWRANTDWGYKLGYSEKELGEVNQLAIRGMNQLRKEYRNHIETVLISGCIGPSTDGYRVINKMTAQQSFKYHQSQIKAFKEAGADLTTAVTMNYLDEAMGIVQAAKKNRLPVVVSFTVETDGNLPSGESLQYAIQTIDLKTGNYPLYYMINCAHPTHFAEQIVNEGEWKERIMGIRANASCKSHAELDEAIELDPGNKNDLAEWYSTLKRQLPNLKVLGGCCGTDITHIEAICNRIGIQKLNHHAA